MGLAASPDITGLLKAWASGDPQALEKLMPLVYDELRRLARAYMRRQRVGQTLQTTALANEAYLRLVGAEGLGCNDRAHFFAVAAQMMRRILHQITVERTIATTPHSIPRLTASLNPPSTH
jgi:RNA polymerase sigma factor (TIGR02999 family)